LDTEKKKISTGDYQKALSSFSKAMEYFHKGNFDKAKQHLEDFIKTHGEEKEILDRAKLYLDIVKAREQKEDIPPKTFEDCYQYGIFRLNQGRYEEAIELFQKANKKKPKQGKIHYALADAYCLMGQKDKCLLNLKEAIKLDEFYGILAQNETDFDPFKEDEEFKSIIEPE
jgi:tetratricopeptide (TPR) repeat protein